MGGGVTIGGCGGYLERIGHILERKAESLTFDARLLKDAQVNKPKAHRLCTNVKLLGKRQRQTFPSDRQPGGHTYKYDAFELNFPCPGGLSGGPVFMHGNPTQVVGLVTGNVRSTTVLDAIEESPDRKTVYREVISYGAALRLSAVESWLSPFCPPREDYSKPASLAQST